MIGSRLRNWLLGFTAGAYLVMAGVFVALHDNWVAVACAFVAALNVAFIEEGR